MAVNNNKLSEGKNWQTLQSRSYTRLGIEFLLSTVTWNQSGKYLAKCMCNWGLVLSSDSQGGKTMKGKREPIMEWAFCAKD